MSFNQVKSLFELNLQKKRQELKELEEKLRYSLYSYHTDIRTLLMERPEVEGRRKNTLNGLKALFRGQKFRVNIGVLDYTSYPRPDYLSIFEYRLTSKTIHIVYTLTVEHETKYNGGDCYMVGIKDYFGITIPFTGEFKRLSLEWQANYKQFSEMEPKFRKLNEFEKNLDNNVNVFLLSYNDPDLYKEADSYISKILDI